MKNYFYKRITITVIIFCVFIQMLAVAYISASETTSVYKKTNAYSACGGKQGYDGWYFMYKNPNTGECEDMTWIGNYFKGIGDERVNEHFIVPGYDTPTVVGWTAPYTGTVTLTAQDNTVYRNGPNPSGEDVIATLRLNDEIDVYKRQATTVKIILGDKTIWNEVIPGDQTDESMGVKHDIIVDVGCGDMIYFDVSAKDPTSAAILWTPRVEYLQAAKFTAEDKQILNASEIKYGDRIECLFYDAGILEKKSNAYLAIYDADGTMMRLSEPVSVGENPKGSGGVLAFDIDFNYKDYGACELELIIINGDGKNINPIVKHDLYSVK